tara:strand:+ start:660 stop:890 length:231 start_codon:yes stop_codon:yes gene_type:complete
MACGLSIERLNDFNKQLDEQATTLANQIQTLETQLKSAQNSYLKVLGAKEIITIQIQESESNQENSTAEVIEGSGD